MNLESIKNEQELREWLAIQKYQASESGFLCRNCFHKKCYKIKKDGMYFATKCKACSHTESLTAFTILNNVKFNNIKALYVYIKLRDQNDIKVSDLHDQTKLRRQTISNFRMRIIDNNFNLFYPDFKVLDQSYYCLQLVKKVKANKQKTKNFQKFLDSDYFNADKELVHLFNAIDEKYYGKEDEQTIELENYQKLKLYNSLKDEDFSIESAKDEQQPFGNELRAKFLALEAMIKDFLIIDEIKERKKVAEKEKISSIDTKIKKLRYSVYLDNKWLDLLEKSLQQDEMLLQQKENTQYITYHYYDLLHYIELMKIKLLKKQDKVITNQINFNRLMLNHDIATFIRRNRITVEYCKTGLELTNNAGIEYLNQSISIQKKLEKFYGKIQFKNSISDLIKFIDIINKYLGTSDRKEFRNFKMLFPLLVSNYERILVEHRKDALEIIIDYCRVFLIKSVITYNDLYDLLEKIIIDNKVLNIEGYITNFSLKYFILIYCRAKEFMKARALLNANRSNVNEKVWQFNNEVIRFYEDASDITKIQLVENPFDPQPLGLAYEIGWFMIRIKSRYTIDLNFNLDSVNYFEEFRSFINEKKKDEIKQTDRLACLNFIEIFIQLYYIKQNEKLNYSLVWDTETKRTIRNAYDPEVQDLEQIKQVLLQQEYNIDKFWLMERIIDFELKTLQKIVSTSSEIEFIKSMEWKNFVQFINDADPILFDHLHNEDKPLKRMQKLKNLVWPKPKGDEVIDYYKNVINPKISEKTYKLLKG